jgi:serine/threonine protein kinase
MEVAAQVLAKGSGEEDIESLVGRSVAHYGIVEMIGEGGMGVVYKAHDTRLNRSVAIKALPDIFAADPERLVRFEREAKVLASLNHPNIASVYGLEKSDGKSFLGDVCQNFLSASSFRPNIPFVLGRLARLT